MAVLNFKQRNYIILAIIVALGLLLGYAARGLLSAVLGAIVFYTIFRSLNIWLTEKKHFHRALAAIIILLISFFVVILPVSTMVSMVASKIHEVASNPSDIQALFSNIDKFANEKFHQPHLIQDVFSKLQSVGVSIISSAVSGVASTLFTLSIMYFLLYFMFSDYKAMETALMKYSPLTTADNLRFGNEVRNMTYSNVLGQALIAVVQGGLLAIGFLIFGAEDALFWGVITVFLAFVPLIGAPLVFVPVAIIQISNGHTGQGVGLLLWGFILVTNIDNVLRYFISKKVADTHPIITIIGVIIGIPMFGMLGLVFGPLLMSFFILLVKIYELNRLKLNDPESQFNDYE
ncbi:AI-2E family transporter [Solitalea koreensis]|uniref:Predicted PurR-regulated permease PerM n=1 Tax=Solitalea koreensis TaxID=543615 RepID=A0A521BY98_9SPHI|nr:AI-2E family transporter [Solitalea koreensis]SMO52025.1 Predicted PurR-regulated permease PerM [Solitalea koreensis]